MIGEPASHLLSAQGPVARRTCQPQRCALAVLAVLVGISTRRPVSPDLWARSCLIVAKPPIAGQVEVLPSAAGFAPKRGFFDCHLLLVLSSLVWMAVT